MPEPGVKIGKIDPLGKIPIEFNQPFKVPDNFEEYDYSGTFDLAITSSIDDSTVMGQFVKSSQGRRLESNSNIKDCEDGCEAQHKTFVWYINSHTSEGIDLKT